MTERERELEATIRDYERVRGVVSFHESQVRMATAAMEECQRRIAELTRRKAAEVA